MSSPPCVVDGFWRVQILGSVASTQDIARSLADSGEPEGLAIQALQQTGGRGRHGNAWVSPMGNLYLSVLLRPSCEADRAGQLAFVSAVALSEAMDGVMDTSTHTKRLKWPNDILVDGQKISGILLETDLTPKGRTDFVLIGTGVNIFAPPEGRIGLDSVKRVPVFVNKFRDSYLACLYKYYDLWRKKGFAPIRAAWLKQAKGLGGDMTIRMPEVSYSGVFEGIDENGALVAKVDGRQRVFTAGEVHFGPSPHQRP